MKSFKYLLSLFILLAIFSFGIFISNLNPNQVEIVSGQSNEANALAAFSSGGAWVYSKDFSDKSGTENYDSDVLQVTGNGWAIRLSDGARIYSAVLRSLPNGNYDLGAHTVTYYLGIWGFYKYGAVTQVDEVCEPGFVETYQCLNDDISQQQYRNNDCSTRWVNTTCDRGCHQNSGKCYTVNYEFGGVSGSNDSTEDTSCRIGYTDNLRCNGNSVQQEYLNSSCRATWITRKSCVNGCSNGACIDGSSTDSSSTSSGTSDSADNSSSNTSDTSSDNSDNTSDDSRYNGIGYTDDYQCLGSLSQRKYCTNDRCSTFVWVSTTYCGVNQCNESTGQCSTNTETTCSVGLSDDYKCESDTSYRKGYSTTSCSSSYWVQHQYCGAGQCDTGTGKCKSTQPNDNLCSVGPSTEYKCDGRILKQKEYTNTSCSYYWKTLKYCGFRTTCSATAGDCVN